MNLTIEDTIDGTTLSVAVKGKIDGLGAIQFEKHLNKSFADMSASFKPVKKLILDLTGVQYVSSAGIRVFIIISKHMASQGELVVQNVPKDVMNNFTTCGLNKLLKIRSVLA